VGSGKKCYCTFRWGSGKYTVRVIGPCKSHAECHWHCMNRMVLTQRAIDVYVAKLNSKVPAPLGRKLGTWVHKDYPLTAQGRCRRGLPFQAPPTK
jgi:hypothetical protein